MRDHVDRTWMCLTCGYAMDRAAPMGGRRAVPEEGDLSICINCAAPYTREGNAWRAMTKQEVIDLPPKLRSDLALAMLASRKVRLERGTDLSKRDGRA